ncbi:hypothetical protein BBOV_I001710 [Babesia bovis T2Bo]|uniref:Uncharacterized protein n=1 Tax=Babesia bovis TaxID=5865 RepID=A7AW27_BABBO|nr:hypothetical protein BBOV_I001710 [Babesia bovis T2Bo]EDO05255.1 hypothetical protein BBOV_I001710 [Babesia bovis T2Bo]|eukprot:XP_001608823.1 hypothetical protein [Babesia bovis T2Bo]
MPIDYSKWDNLELSDSDDDRKPNVIKLDGSQRVQLGRNGYNIVSNSPKVNTSHDLVALSKFWKKHVENGSVVERSHVFSQSRYEICLLIAVREEQNAKFDVVVTKSRLKILRSGVEIFNREFYATVKDTDDCVIWRIVRQNVDWKAIEAWCNSSQTQNSDKEITFTEFYQQSFIEIELTKENSIADCFIWWPKAFKDDEKSIKFVSKGGQTFMESWNQAHEAFRERVKNFEKVNL